VARSRLKKAAMRRWGIAGGRLVVTVPETLVRTALGIFGLFAGAIAIAVGAATGSPAVARGVAALAVEASYLINALAQVTSTLRPARPISPYYLVLGNEPLAHGLQLTGAVSVLTVAAAIAAVGGILFARRDLN
jgi:ABC-2 type transport system permease protein